MKGQWEKDIRDQLKGFSRKAPEGLLDDIKQEMNRRHPVSASSRYRHLARIASIAAVIALWMGISYLWENGQTDPVTEIPELPTIAGTGTIAKIGTPASQPVTPVVDTVITATPTILHLTALADDVLPPQTDTPNTQEEETPSEEKEPMEEKEESRRQTQASKDTAPTPKPTQRTYTPSRKRTVSYTLGVYYAGITNPAKRPSDEVSFQPSTPSIPGGEAGNPGGNPDNPTETDSTTTSRNVTSPLPSGLDGTAKHHFPIRAGISFRYHLNEQWYLQSGLTYSYLASDISNVSLSVSYKTKQKLHYIGIPLQAGYRIWDNKQFKGYVSIGGQVERLASGKAHVRYTFANHEHTAVDKNIDDSHLWFSALASIGAEYKLGKSFSLYAEPGIHYYFENGSRLQTYYNAHPLNFSLTLGLRFHWEK